MRMFSTAKGVREERCNNPFWKHSSEGIKRSAAGIQGYTHEIVRPARQTHDSFKEADNREERMLAITPLQTARLLKMRHSPNLAFTTGILLSMAGHRMNTRILLCAPTRVVRPAIEMKTQSGSRFDKERKRRKEGHESRSLWNEAKSQRVKATHHKTKRHKGQQSNTMAQSRRMKENWRDTEDINNDGYMTNPSPTKLRQASQLTPDSCPALVLNADYSPLSYMPLSLWPWQEVVKAVFLDRVTVVETYDIGVRSPSTLFQLPSVISLKQYQPIESRKVAFSRFNVFLRDTFSCQYCGRRFPTQDLTFDHVIPRCRGGKTNWENVVTACMICNHNKGRKLLNELSSMNLRQRPREPSNFELQLNARKFPPPYLHETWRDYIYWNESMEVEKN